MQIISLFHQFYFIRYERLLSNTRNGLKGRRKKKKTPYREHKTELNVRTVKVK
jgi:hypothetical protein